jgi:hypothetical protein
VAACLAALSLAASASPAAASVTIGQLDPNPGAFLCPATARDYAQGTVASGNPYVVPEVGTITSWSLNAAGAANQMLTMKVFRKVGDPARLMVVGHDGPRPLAASTVNTFPASIPVKPGDVLGLNAAGTSMTSCYFTAPGDSVLSKLGNLADGDSDDFISGTGVSLNISAVFAPSNSFTLGATTRNKKKGTATLNLNLPNPGELTASGNGVKAASARAVTSKSVTAGSVQLLIKAKGKKKRKLNETGKVKLNAAITYTPTNGDPSTQSTKLKLKKR